uniref:Meiosis 1 associated protein n=1 Tax=Nothoprocta perdicaria TaxID=30464 RepID=A0A8C7A4X1_NOTPE
MHPKKDIWFPATKTHSQQPSRILIVDVTSPSWTNTCSVLSEALENVLCLACSLAGPCRIPLLSLYVVQNHQECLLPFMQVKESFARVQSCLSELRSLPREGCLPRGVNAVAQAVQDGLQQFKQYSRHTLEAALALTLWYLLQITILTSESGKEMVKQLEKKLKDVDLVSLRRLQIIEVLKREFLEPEGAEQSAPAEEPGCDDIAILGMDMDVQTVEDNVISLEMLFKAWLHDYGTDREQLHLLLPSGGFSHQSNFPLLVCLKCDLQERLLDPALFDGMRTADLSSSCQLASWPATALYKLRVVKALKAEGVCESVVYGLPFIIKPTSCWQLDWDELETNQHSFHALCYSLLKRNWMLLAKCEPQNTSPSWNIMVHSYYIIIPSDSATLLVKAVAVRELLLPSTFPALLTEHPERVSLQNFLPRSALNSLEVEVTYNPLHLRNNLYKYLKNVLRRPVQRQQAQPREQRPERHQPKQHQSRAKATVAPLLMAPSPVQVLRAAAVGRDSCEHSLLFGEEDEFIEALQ